MLIPSTQAARNHTYTINIPTLPINCDTRSKRQNNWSQARRKNHQTIEETKLYVSKCNLLVRINKKMNVRQLYI